MPYQMKGIGNGKQEVQCLLPETWKSLHEHNDHVNYMEQLAFLFPSGDKCLVATECFSWKNIF
jgi:hypothetical protein